MDITSISVFGFSLLRIIIWVIVILYSIYLVRKINKENDSEDSKLSDVLYFNKFGIIFVVLLLAFAVLYTANESAYRPKTVINPPNKALNDELRRIDNSSVPEIKPGSSIVPDIKKTDSYNKNRESNKETIDNFMNLPDSKAKAD
jgi:hypothetical protein